MVYSKALVAAAATFMGLANAHMVMESPIPFNPENLDNGPLLRSGADYPCKFTASKETGGSYLPGKFDSSKNVFAIGEKIPLTFKGSAVHGGGSCQVSLTTDKEPTKNSEFKVIHSILGGCPANVDGNLPEDPNGHGASKFEFQIPSSIAPGEYTLAWTWFNRIGNREMYMNCAPIKVTGGSKKRWEPTPKRDPRSFTPLAKRADMPNIFIANVELDSQPYCETAEGMDVMFPVSGDSVVKAGMPSRLQKEGDSVCANMGGSSPKAGSGGSGNGGNGGDKGGSPAPSSTYAPTVPSPTEAPTYAPGPTGTAPANDDSSPGNGGVFLPAPTANPTAPTAPVPVPTGTGMPTPPGNGTAHAGPCTEEGKWSCSGTQYQRCASGQWTVLMNLPAGVTCESLPGKRAPMHRRRGHYLPLRV
ncbi:Chitin-binding, domain 3 [Trichophyton interdigitale]|uniref:Chitin-binding, domain 3 n=1 Tax=Trichophyton interdigitale TaxID=101480 RepID=A0A9P5CVM4_9EURO|nr:Chitin-binding, domain 3 [Trichophyton interdigitale]KAG5209725.1 Chitin-binding, domain 3 [Trichophyton interdigitale]KAG8208971.1 Chitin-binding, domain 3 [Trichophyton interdigitale]